MVSSAAKTFATSYWPSSSARYVQRRRVKLLLCYITTRISSAHPLLSRTSLVTSNVQVSNGPFDALDPRRLVMRRWGLNLAKLRERCSGWPKRRRIRFGALNLSSVPLLSYLLGCRNITAGESPNFSTILVPFAKPCSSFFFRIRPFMEVLHIARVWCHFLFHRPPTFDQATAETLFRTR